MKIISFEDRCKKIKGLKQNKDKPLEQIKQLALDQIEREKLKVDWVGLTKDEEKLADNLYANYVNANHIEGWNDLEDLKTLVFNSILENRIKQNMYDLANDSDGNKIPNKFVMDSITSLQKQNLDLKNKLGLNKSKKLGWLDFWAGLCEKLNIHAVHNRGAFTFKCSDCGKMVLLLRKVADYNIFNFACFRGTSIYSEELLSMIDETINTGSTKVDFKRAANIFGCSDEYLQGCYEKIYLKEKQNVKK